MKLMQKTFTSIDTETLTYYYGNDMDKKEEHIRFMTGDDGEYSIKEEREDQELGFIVVYEKVDLLINKEERFL